MALPHTDQLDRFSEIETIPLGNERNIANTPCIHCGSLCHTGMFALADKSFCCRGCLTVFEILTANGLTEFYTLRESAGVRVTTTAKDDHFKFLEILTTENHLGFLYIRLKGVGTTTHES